MTTSELFPMIIDQSSPLTILDDRCMKEVFIILASLTFESILCGFLSLARSSCADLLIHISSFPLSCTFTEWTYLRIHQFH